MESNWKILETSINRININLFFIFNLMFLLALGWPFPLNFGYVTDFYLAVAMVATGVLVCSVFLIHSAREFFDYKEFFKTDKKAHTLRNIELTVNVVGFCLMAVGAFVTSLVTESAGAVGGYTRLAHPFSAVGFLIVLAGGGIVLIVAPKLYRKYLPLQVREFEPQPFS